MKRAIILAGSAISWPILNISMAPGLAFTTRCKISMSIAYLQFAFGGGKNLQASD